MMKSLLFAVLFAARVSAADDISVFFSPDGGCTEAIVAEIGKATESVHVQAYSFTSLPIAKALVEAAKRVKVNVLLDKSQVSEKYSSADFLAHAGVPVAIDSGHAIAHNKIIVVDGKVVITGSFNFSSAAETKNAENLLILRREDIAVKYMENWTSHAKHSKPYAGR